MRDHAGEGNRARSALAIGLALVAAVGMAAEGRAAKAKPAMPGKAFSWTFQADTLGQKPAHSIAFGGTWAVLEDSTTKAHPAVIVRSTDDSGDSATAAAIDSMMPSTVPARRLLTQSESDAGLAYHYLTFTRPLLEDLDATVRFRIRSGEMDPSAGLMFQMDPKGTSGYVLRASGKRGELVFHYLLYGKRRDVKFAKIDPPAPGDWHTIAVIRRRSTLRAFYDGKEVMAVRDDRFSKGTVGVWTEDDTLVDFADLTATAR